MESKRFTTCWEDGRNVGHDDLTVKASADASVFILLGDHPCCEKKMPPLIGYTYLLGSLQGSRFSFSFVDLTSAF